MLRASKMHCLFRDYCEELRDSLDLVPIGAWHGNGRKVGWYSPFLLAAYDPDTEEFQSVCRCMSGYTDAFYAEASLAPLTPAACSTACAWCICYGKRLNIVKELCALQSCVAFHAQSMEGVPQAGD